MALGLHHSYMHHSHIWYVTHPQNPLLFPLPHALRGTMATLFSSHHSAWWNLNIFKFLAFLQHPYIYHCIVESSSSWNSSCIRALNLDIINLSIYIISGYFLITATTLSVLLLIFLSPKGTVIFLIPLLYISIRNGEALLLIYISLPKFTETAWQTILFFAPAASFPALPAALSHTPAS